MRVNLVCRKPSAGSEIRLAYRESMIALSIIKSRSCGSKLNSVRVIILRPGVLVVPVVLVGLEAKPEDGQIRLLTEYAPKINALFERVKTMRGMRNQVLHWLHEGTDSQDIVRFTDKRRGRERKPKDFTAANIQKIADSIRDCYGEILEWWNLYNWHCEI
jgi:hypothetical protein